MSVLSLVGSRDPTEDVVMFLKRARLDGLSQFYDPYTAITYILPERVLTSLHASSAKLHASSCTR